MKNDDLNLNDDIIFDFNKSNIDTFLEAMIPISGMSDNDEIFDANLEASIDDTIEKLEKILNLEALSDDEMIELYAIDDELHDDIDILDFDGEY